MPGARLASFVSPPLLIARLVSSVCLPLLMCLDVMMLIARFASSVSLAVPPAEASLRSPGPAPQVHALSCFVVLSS